MNSTLPVPELVSAYQAIIDYLKSNTQNKSALDNFEGSATRCAKALVENFHSDDYISKELKKILSSTFPCDKGSESTLIVQGPISINSMCPHHLYPVRYQAFIGYVPGNNVLGLSKLSRIAKILGGRPVLHEQLVNDIALVLCGNHNTFPSIDTKGSAVQLVGQHLCIACRGVKEDSLTSISSFHGIVDRKSFRDEIETIKNSRVFGN